MYRSRSAAISRSFKNLWAGSSRTARSHQPRTIDPELTRQALLHNYKAAHGDYSIAGSSRNGKSAFRFKHTVERTTFSFAQRRELNILELFYLVILLQRSRITIFYVLKYVATTNYIVTQWRIFIISLISC